MTFGGNTFNYFPQNKLTKLAYFVQFKRMLMFCLEDLGEAAPPPCLRHWCCRHDMARCYLFLRPRFQAISQSILD